MAFMLEEFFFCLSYLNTQIDVKQAGGRLEKCLENLGNLGGISRNRELKLFI